MPSYTVVSGLSVALSEKSGDPRNSSKTSDPLNSCGLSGRLASIESFFKRQSLYSSLVKHDEKGELRLKGNKETELEQRQETCKTAHCCNA